MLRHACAAIAIVTFANTIVTCTIASPAEDTPSPQPAALLAAEDKIELEFTGTGETIGEVMKLTVKNKTPQPLAINVPPMLLVSTKRDTQDYAAPFGQTVSVPGGDAVAVPVIGVCLVRDKPALGAGVSGATLALTSDGQPLVPPAEDAPDSIKNLPDTEQFSTKNVDRLLTIAESHYAAARELREEEELENIPYPDPQMKENIVVEWGIWSDPDIATILGHEPATKDDLADVINEQVAENFGGEVPEDVQKKVDMGIESIFAGVQLTKERAKQLEKKRGPPAETTTIDDSVMEIDGGPLGDPKLKKREKPKKKPNPIVTVKKKDGTVVLTKKEEGTTFTETRYPNGKIKIEFDEDGLKQTVVFDGDKIITTQEHDTGKATTVTTRLTSPQQSAVDEDGKRIRLTDDALWKIKRSGWHPFLRESTLREDKTYKITKWFHLFGRLVETIEVVDKEGKQYVKRLTINHIDNSRTEKTWYLDGSTKTKLTEYLNGLKTKRETTIHTDTKGKWLRTERKTIPATGSINTPPSKTTVHEKSKSGGSISTTKDGTAQVTTKYRPNGTPEETTYVRKDGSRKIIVKYDDKGGPKAVTTTTQTTKKVTDDSGYTAEKKTTRVSEATFNKDRSITTKETETEDIEGEVKKYPLNDTHSKPTKGGGRIVEERDASDNPIFRTEYKTPGKPIPQKWDWKSERWVPDSKDRFAKHRHLVFGPEIPKPSPKLPTAGKSIRPPTPVDPVR